MRFGRSARATPLNVLDPSRIHGRVQGESEVIELRRQPEAPEAHEAPEAPPSFDELFLELHDRLYRALYFISGSSAEAEELMQDAFLKLWERWDRIDEIDDPTSYVFRTALNGFRARTRRARMAARRIAPVVHPRDPFDDVDVREDVRRMLRRLSPRQRTAIVLTEILGYSSEQAAVIMRIRPTTVRVLASQGRAALREIGRPR
jgi:RNA polymerase sigma factor (sigma-70 family)